MIFVPQSSRATDAVLKDEAGVVEALHRLLDPKNATGCLNPILRRSYLDAGHRKWAREEVRDETSRKPSREEVRQNLISETLGSWGTVDGKNENLAASMQNEIATAYADLVMSAPRQRQPRVLKASELPNISLRSDCVAWLDRPVIHGGWAFVSLHSPTAGHLYALRRDAAGWTVVGHRFTAIS